MPSNRAIHSFWSCFFFWFGLHQSLLDDLDQERVFWGLGGCFVITVFAPEETNRAKRENELEFDSSL